VRSAAGGGGWEQRFGASRPICDEPLTRAARRGEGGARRAAESKSASIWPTRTALHPGLAALARSSAEQCQLLRNEAVCVRICLAMSTMKVGRCDQRADQLWCFNRVNDSSLVAAA
jgi:hypothetical protein